ncbi:hypothetical protein GQ44DRAFT_756154 [Phaeosphaeriaceae sp. PMI808]|nr:hypothetical protein GQ44DRAFT_756154 [Phaeosphaeriaceae sp. PMI808]
MTPEIKRTQTKTKPMSTTHALIPLLGSSLNGKSSCASRSDIERNAEWFSFSESGFLRFQDGRRIGIRFVFFSRAVDVVVTMSKGRRKRKTQLYDDAGLQILARGRKGAQYILTPSIPAISRNHTDFISYKPYAPLGLHDLAVQSSPFLDPSRVPENEKQPLRPKALLAVKTFRPMVPFTLDKYGGF